MLNGIGNEEREIASPLLYHALNFRLSIFKPSWQHKTLQGLRRTIHFGKKFRGENGLLTSKHLIFQKTEQKEVYSSFELCQDADANRGAAKYATDIEQRYHQASIFIALTAIVYTVEVIN